MISCFANGQLTFKLTALEDLLYKRPKDKPNLHRIHSSKASYIKWTGLEWAKTSYSDLLLKAMNFCLKAKTPLSI